MKRDRNPDATNATIGLIPNGMSGLVQPRHPFTSMSHAQVAMPTHAMPAVKSTYELVHRFFPIGNDHAHTSPAIMPSAPAANSAEMRSSSGVDAAIQRPAIVPSTTVAVA